MQQRAVQPSPDVLPWRITAVAYGKGLEHLVGVFRLTSRDANVVAQVAALGPEEANDDAPGPKGIIHCLGLKATYHLAEDEIGVGRHRLEERHLGQLHKQSVFLLAHRVHRDPEAGWNRRSADASERPQM